MHHPRPQPEVHLDGRNTTYPLRLDQTRCSHQPLRREKKLNSTAYQWVTVGTGSFLLALLLLSAARAAPAAALLGVASVFAAVIAAISLGVPWFGFIFDAERRVGGVAAADIVATLPLAACAAGSTSECCMGATVRRMLAIPSLLICALVLSVGCAAVAAATTCLTTSRFWTVGSGVVLALVGVLFFAAVGCGGRVPECMVVAARRTCVGDCHHTALLVSVVGGVTSLVVGVTTAALSATAPTPRAVASGGKGARMGWADPRDE